MRFSVGQPVPRFEDPRLLSGRGRYLDDLRLDGMTHAHILRSPHAHADILSLDPTAARDMSGVLLVLTGEDYAASGLGDLPCVTPFDFRRPDGSPYYRPPRPALVSDRVRFVGDPVALVIAQTAAQARDAAEAIAVEYRPLPVVTETAAAAAPGAPLVWPDCPDNLCFVWQEGDREAVASALERAHTVVRDGMVSQRLSANAMEPRGAVGQWDRSAERFTLYAGLDRPYTVRKDLAENVFRLPETQFRVVALDMGGSFGMKGGTYLENVLVLWAARLLDRPVKWIADRTESFLGDNHCRDDDIAAALALDGDGRFLALQVEIDGSLGAYLATNGPHPKMGNLGTLAGVYDLPAIHVRVTGRFTHGNPISPYRGSGRPEAAYTLERLIDKAARQLDMDPVELRRRNLIPRDGFPYKTALSFTYDSGDFEGCLDRALALSNWPQFPARRAEAADRGMLRGIGLSLSIEQAGGRAQPEMAEIRFDPGGDVTLAVGTVDWGMGHSTSYRQIICDRLGIEPERVRIIEGDTDSLPLGYGTAGSRGMSMGGSAVLRAADKVVAKGKRIAAHCLEVAEADIDFSDGRFHIAGTDRSLSMHETGKIAHQPLKLPQDIDPGLNETGVFMPEVSNFPNGCHVCEVEIDPETGVVRVVDYTVVDDVGTVINPLLLEGQIHGGVTQGLGQVLQEQIRFDRESGQLLTASFMDYAMPRADDLCSFKVATHSVPTETNPVGAKGAGEAGTVGALAAGMSAILNALAPLGVTHLDMPATSERVWRTINNMT